MSFPGWLKAEAYYLSRDLLLPCRVLVISLLGVGLAWFWLSDRALLAAVVIATMLAVGWILDAIGRGRLPHRPVAALLLLEAWILVPSAFSAVGAAALICLTVMLAVPEGAPGDEKALTAAVLAALGGFLTGGLFAWYKDEADDTVSNRIRRVFQSKYARRDPARQEPPGVRFLDPESRAERLVFGETFEGIEGWRTSARWQRAKHLATELAKS